MFDYIYEVAKDDEKKELLNARNKYVLQKTLAVLELRYQ